MAKPEDRISQASRFETKVRDFIKTLGFRDVGGGATLRIGESAQIDVVGGIGEVLLVIDAHSAVEQRRKSVRTKIGFLRGQYSAIRRALKKDRRYKKYREIRLVVATRRVDLTQADRNFASVSPRVYLWDDNLLAYYSKLARSIREHARNELLGELDIETTDILAPQDITVPAVRTRLRGREAYLFFAPAEPLLAISFVSRRERGHEAAYQRLVDRERLADIGKFIGDRRKKGFFANNVILSFRAPVQFTPTKLPGLSKGMQAGALRLPKAMRSAWIIDGQHRLYGCGVAEQGKADDVFLPVIGFADLDAAKQTELFLEINGNQKAIPPNLIWDLEGEIHPTSDMGIISTLVKRLNDRGPLEGAISIPKRGLARRGTLNLGNVCSSILDIGLIAEHSENMLARKRNPLRRARADETVAAAARALNDYFSTCEAVLARDWHQGKDGFFFTNNGINVLLRIYERALAYYGRRPRTHELRRFLKVVWSSYVSQYPNREQREQLRKQTSSEAIRSDVANRFSAAVQEELGLEGFLPESAGTETLGEQVSALERATARVVAKVMSETFGEDWWKSRASPDISGKLRSKGKGRPVDEMLSFGECAQIITRSDNWKVAFEHALLITFRKRERFDFIFAELARIRNDVQHGRPIGQRDRKAYEIYEADLEEALKEIQKQRRSTRKPANPGSSTSSAAPASATGGPGAPEA